jgi:hypothetical protein
MRSAERTTDDHDTVTARPAESSGPEFDEEPVDDHLNNAASRPPGPHGRIGRHPDPVSASVSPAVGASYLIFLACVDVSASGYVGGSHVLGSAECGVGSSSGRILRAATRKRDQRSVEGHRFVLPYQPFEHATFPIPLLPEAIAAPVRLAHAVADPMRWRQQLAVLDRSNLVVQQSSCKCRRAGGVVRADQMRRSRRVQPWPVIRLESKKASLHRHRQSAADRSLRMHFAHRALPDRQGECFSNLQRRLIC